MAGGEWADIAIKTGISFASGLGGLLIGVWKWGRSSAKAEHAVKHDYTSMIAAHREEVRISMAAHAQKADARTDLLVEQFKESFEGIRRQHDDHKLDVEKRFMLKDDFKDFREEYREDIRELKASIAGIARGS